MIGLRFSKPLQNDKLMRTVTRIADIPVYDVAGKVVGYEHKAVDDVEEYSNPAPNTLARYKAAALWCNENGAVITDKGEYYEVCAIPAPTPEELAEQTLAAAKDARATAVASITVTVDGMVFDGDEKAQERMARAVSMADSLDEETEWVLHDSTVAIVTAAQLRQACRAAGKTQTALWIKPYTDTVTNIEQHYTLE